MDCLCDDVLIHIFLRLKFAEKVRLETVCRRWHRVLRFHAVYANMEKLNLADFVRENRLQDENINEKEAPPSLVEQTLAGVVDRAGPHIRQLDFAHRWPKITPKIVQKIAENCTQLRRLDMGWVRFEADISPLLEMCADQLMEFSLEESSWNGEGGGADAEKIGAYLARMPNLRRLNLRKFPQPLEQLAKMEGPQLEFLDVSEAAQLTAKTLIEFLGRNSGQQLVCLHLCPMPVKCLPLVAGSTTSAINRPGPFIGFMSGAQQIKNEKQQQQRGGKEEGIEGGEEQEQGQTVVRRRRGLPKKGADLQALVDRLGKMPRLRTLWLGHIPYSAHFLQLAPLGDLEELRHLHLKEINALDGSALKAILQGTRDHLRQLSLLNCVYLDDFSSLAVCAFLIQLDVEKANKLDDQALQGLAQHARLRIVRINECPKVSDTAIWALAEKCPLKELDLIKCQRISAEFFKNGQIFGKCERLERISLSGCEAITNDSIRDAIDVLPLVNLQQLDLSRNMNIDDSALDDIRDGLEKKKSTRQNIKPLIVYCTGTGISRERVDRFEPSIELAFY